MLKPMKPKLNRSQAIRDYLAQNPKAKPKAIRDALRAKGIHVTQSLVGAVIYKKPKKGPRRPKARRPGRPPSVRRTQARVAQAAKTGGMNKSDAVRAYLKQNPSASPKAIRDALKSKGIMISVGLASAVKYAKPKGRRPGRPRGRRTSRPAAATRNGTLNIEHLLEAKKFVDRVGGIEAARRAVEVLKRLA